MQKLAARLPKTREAREAPHSCLCPPGKFLNHQSFSILTFSDWLITIHTQMTWDLRIPSLVIWWKVHVFPYHIHCCVWMCFHVMVSIVFFNDVMLKNIAVPHSMSISGNSCGTISERWGIYTRLSTCFLIMILLECNGTFMTESWLGVVTGYYWGCAFVV